MAEKESTTIPPLYSEEVQSRIEAYPQVNVREARRNLAHLRLNAQINGVPTVITQHGQPAAAIIPMEWFAVLQKMGLTESPESYYEEIMRKADSMMKPKSPS